MNRLLAALLVFVVAGCGADKVPEIPAFGVGDGGAHFMSPNDAKTPFEAFNNTYTDLTKQHINIKRNLEPSTRNRYGVECALQRIVRDLEIMQSVLVRPDPSTLDPYIKFYKECLEDAKRDRTGGSWSTKIEQNQREIKLKYAPDECDIAAAFESGDSRKTDEGDTSTSKVDPKKEGDTLPNPKEKKEEPRKTDSQPKEQPKEETKTEKSSSGVSFRLLYDAWERAHAKLVEAYSSKKECGEKYQDVLEALKLMKARVEKSKADKLQIYIGYYESLNEKTKGFTTLPEKETQESLLGEFKIVASVLESMFNPDKK